MSNGNWKHNDSKKKWCNRNAETEKPIELLERLIKLHTKEDDIVLDCFAGSFSTADACKRLNRQCIAIELEKEYYDKGVNRLSGSLF